MSATTRKTTNGNNNAHYYYSSEDEKKTTSSAPTHHHHHHNNMMSSKRNKRSQQKKRSSKTTKLLWTIGTIAGFVVIVNVVSSLVHDGSLPYGITIILSQGDEETKWTLGGSQSTSRRRARQQQQQQHQQRGNVQELHYLPPPRKLIKKLQRQKAEQQDHYEHYLQHVRAKHHNNERHGQKYHHGQKHQQQQADVHPPLKKKTPPKRGEASTTTATRQQLQQQQQQKVKPINGQQLQYQKEMEKGGVHNMAYYFALSEKNGHDKERLLTLLRDNAGLRYISQKSYDALPSWSQVTSMYGDRPRLVGLEQCQTFQNDGVDLADKFLAVAGAFNSGTNLLAKIITRNCVLHKRQAKYGAKQRGIRWQVPYGKHTPPSNEEFRNSHVAAKSDGVTAQNVLPAVMIRDPFRWLQSMCGHHYTSRWPRVHPRGHPNYHCPNLFPTLHEQTKFHELDISDTLPIIEEEDKDLDLKAIFSSFNETKEKERAVFIGIRPEKPQQQQQQHQQEDHEDDPTADYHGEEKEDNSKKDDSSKDNNNNLQHTQEEEAADSTTTILSPEELDRHYFPVRVKYSNFTREHRSLVHFYNEWYQEYLDLKDYPHILIRMEDLLFFPDDVVPQICECAGGQLITYNITTSSSTTSTNTARLSGGGHQHRPVRVVAQSAKAKHSTKFMAEGEEHTGYLDALIKYGTRETRFRGMTPQDLQYAGRHLDANIMDLFGYDYPQQQTTKDRQEEEEEDQDQEDGAEGEEKKQEDLTSKHQS